MTFRSPGHAEEVHQEVADGVVSQFARTARIWPEGSDWDINEVGPRVNDGRKKGEVK